MVSTKISRDVLYKYNITMANLWRAGVTLSGILFPLELHFQFLNIKGHYKYIYTCNKIFPRKNTVL